MVVAGRDNPWPDEARDSARRKSAPLPGEAGAHDSRDRSLAGRPERARDPRPSWLALAQRKQAPSVPGFRGLALAPGRCPSRSDRRPTRSAPTQARASRSVEISPKGSRRIGGETRAVSAAPPPRPSLGALHGTLGRQRVQETGDPLSRVPEARSHAVGGTCTHAYYS